MSNRIILPYSPRGWQQRVHREMRRFSVIVLHRRAGKTVLALNTLVTAALRDRKPHPRYSYVAPFQNQARDVAWHLLKQYTHMIPDIKYNEQEAAAYFPHNNSRIRLHGADNAEAMRGKYNDGLVLDEVAQMKPEVWGSILRPTLIDRKGFGTFIGTPNGVNLFSDLYFRADNTLPGMQEWYRVLLTCYDTDVLDPDEIEAARAEMSEMQFRREMLCDFNAVSDEVLITLDDVRAAQARHYPPEEYQYAARILACDVARYGNDRSVIIRRQGLVAHKPAIYTGIDNMALADKVAVTCDTFRPDAIFIDAGRGEGVIDRLRQLGYDVVGVDFGGTAGSPEFFNKGAEMWCAMRDAIRNGLALPNMPEFRVDLTSRQIDFKHASGKLRLESKDSMRERGMPSPDLGDALALTFAYPVAPRQRDDLAQAIAQREMHQSLYDYNPLEGL